MSTVRLPMEEAQALVTMALVRSRTSPENAASVARALVAAEANGQIGHGLRRVVAYAGQAAAGKVEGFATPIAERLAPGALLIDAGHGFAFPALDLALAELPDIASSQGIAFAGIRRSHHCGVTGLFVEQLADLGYLALMFANSPAAMAPWGGKKPLFGTNPIAFAAPLAGEPPIVIDLSLSRVARGKVMAAAQKGEPIPDGWAFDVDGQPTNSAEEALVGTMAPLGDAKGAALALMVELLAAGLTRSNYAYEATSFFDAEGAPPGVGQALIVFDSRLIGGEIALERFAELARLVEGEDGTRLPGRRRQTLRAEADVKGIEVDAGLIAEIEAVGR